MFQRKFFFLALCALLAAGASQPRMQDKSWGRSLVELLPASMHDFFTAEPEASRILHLAVVGPMAGENDAGKIFQQSLQILNEDFSREIADHGIAIQLHPFDDGNDPKQAADIAHKIAANKEILGVIGHYSPAASLAAARIYQEAGVPLISPTVTAPALTQDNPWAFRTIFEDGFQGRFLAQYAKSILARDRVVVVHGNSPQSQFLAKAYQDQARLMGQEVSLTREYPSNAEELAAQLPALVDELTPLLEKETLLFLVGQAKDVAQLIVALRDNEVESDILLPDGVRQQELITAFGAYPKELQSPGYYSDGLFLATPLLADSSSELAQNFAKRYQRRFGQIPNWRAAHTYDAGLMFAKAAQLGGMGEAAMTPEEKRAAMRNKLASFNHLKASFEGLTGLNYFDAGNNMNKPLAIGTFRHNRLIAAGAQLKAAGDPKRLVGLEDQVKEGLLVQLDNSYFHKTYIVYTGVDLGEIKSMDHENMVYEMEFELWFRYQRGIDVRNIVFCNEAEPVKLRMPAEEVAYDNRIYRRYKVKGKFKVDLVEPESARHHNMGICFTHRDLNRANLIFVPDYVGGNMEPHTLDRSQQLDIKRVVGWVPELLWTKQGIYEKPVQGNLKYLNEPSKQVPFSSFYTVISLQAEHSLIRNVFTPEVAFFTIPFCILLIMLMDRRFLLDKWHGVRKRKRLAALKMRPEKGFFYFHNYSQPMEETDEIEYLPWFLKMLGMLLLVYACEVLTIDYYFRMEETEMLEKAKTFFDVVWWILPASIIVRGVRRFVWDRIELATGRDIPKFARVFFDVIIFSLALFAILAFVYGETVTSILGTSGIFVMIIGMAIQMNISNIFAGLVLNMEKSIQVGDWIEAEDIEESQVEEISWRTVKLRTREGSIIHVPNQTLSDSYFENYSRPYKIYEEKFPINMEQHDDYDKVVKTILTAINGTPGVLADPKPEVRFREYTFWSACYVAVYYFDDYAARRHIRAAVWERLVKALKKRALKPAVFRDEPQFDDQDTVGPTLGGPLDKDWEDQDDERR